MSGRKGRHRPVAGDREDGRSRSAAEIELREGLSVGWAAGRDRDRVVVEARQRPLVRLSVGSRLRIPSADAIDDVEGQARDSIVHQDNLRNVEWSKVLFVSHDDLIALETPAPENDAVVADIEMVRVRPGNRLCGRYERGL